MSNDCNFDIKVRGKKKDVLTLADWLSAYYDYTDSNNPRCYLVKDDGDVPCAHHIGYRVKESMLIDDLSDYEDDDEVIGDINGYCAWSCHSCMFEGSFSYLSDDDNKQSFAISLPNACKELQLELELFSSEPGECFAEHYFINKEGVILVEDCVEYYEKDLSDITGNYDSYEEFKNDNLETDITEEEYNSGDDYVTVCDLMDNGCWNYQFIY